MSYKHFYTLYIHIYTYIYTCTYIYIYTISISNIGKHVRNFSLYSNIIKLFLIIKIMWMKKTA